MRINLKNEAGDVRQRKLGFSWTVLFFHFWPMVFRKDWKWAAISFGVWLAPVAMWVFLIRNVLNQFPSDAFTAYPVNEAALEHAFYDLFLNEGLMQGATAMVLFFYLGIAYFLFMAFTYNKREIKKLQRLGFAPASEFDEEILLAKSDVPSLNDEKDKGFLAHFQLSRAKKIWAVLAFFGGQFVFGFIFVPLLMLLGIVEEESLFSWIQFLVSGTITVIFLFMFGRHFVDEFRRIGHKGKFFGKIVVGWLAVMLFSTVAGLIVALIYPTSETALNQQLVEEMVLANPILMAFSVIIFAIVTEEVVFRLVMMKWLEKYPWIGIIASSLVFGLIHVAFTGDFHFIIVYGAMGIPIGYSYYKTRNIWYPMGIHFLQNLFAFGTILAFSYLF